MISNELGFTTMGSNVLKAEIPVGWHTGKHAHGEESMHILKGEGFSVIDGQRFDWHEGSTLQIPYRAEHQHFNTGREPALYISGMTFSLETFVRLANLIQFDDCGPNDPAVLAAIPDQESEYYKHGDRAIIHLEDAPDDIAYDPQGHLPALKNQHDYCQYLVVPRNGFKDASVSITHLWAEPPYHHSGRHKHLEAVVYALEGEGYTEMLGQKYFWEAGDVLYVPPAMWEHEHYNDSPNRIRQLRIQFGIRFWYTGIWPEGYTNTRIYDAQGRPIEAGVIERVRERD
jgi:quercetin dioxygenase-like cupin family protein